MLTTSPGLHLGRRGGPGPPRHTLRRGARNSLPGQHAGAVFASLMLTTRRSAGTPPDRSSPGGMRQLGTDLGQNVEVARRS